MGVPRQCPLESVGSYLVYADKRFNTIADDDDTGLQAIILPLVDRDRFLAIGIRPPKGCLMYGPPGTGKVRLSFVRRVLSLVWLVLLHGRVRFMPGGHASF